MKRAFLAIPSFGLIGTPTASEERGDAFAEAAQSRIKEQSNVLVD
jgi:hypothetical protein